MDNFTLFGITAGIVWLAAASKLVSDQLKLLRLYRQELDPPYPLLPGETDKMFVEKGYSQPRLLSLLQIPQTKRRIQIVFAHHPKSSNLERHAKKVKHDLLMLLLIAIMFTIIFANLDLS